MSAADVLERAADYIEEHGWVRGVLERADGHVCAVGAIRAAGSGYPYASLVDDGWRALNALERHVGESVPQWNDHQRDRRKVVRAMREAAANLRVAS